MALYLTETVSMFRHTYVIECKSLEHAYDTITMNEAEELDQSFLTETIVSGREITKEEFAEIVKTSMNGHLGERAIHTVNYDL